MNKRQWKKRYKKIHGYNPPTAKQVKRGIDVLSIAIDKIWDVFCNFLKILIRGIEDIKTMPDKEFEKKLQLLTLEQQELALKIRYKRKEKTRNENMSEM